MNLKKLRLLPLNLQFFANENLETGDDSGDSGADTGVDPAGSDDDKGAESKEERLELTADELAKKIEAESDRKLQKALAKKQKEWEQSLADKIEEARKETERLSKLSEKERKDEELKKREADLAKRLAELNRKELKADAIADLAEKDLPAEFAEWVLGEDAESTLANINELKAAFDKAVNEAVKSQLRQGTPKIGGGKVKPSKNPSLRELAQEARLIK